MMEIIIWLAVVADIIVAMALPLGLYEMSIREEKDGRGNEEVGRVPQHRHAA